MATFSLSEFVKETRRRRVFRLAAIYIVGSWVLIQIALAAFPAFEIPDTAIRYVWIGAILGLPVALIFGWRYDIVGGRVLRTAKLGVSSDLTLSRADFLILSAIAMAAVVIVVKISEEITDFRRPTYEVVWSDDVDPASIAVLPFVNMSTDPDNEYFADGLSEEILNGLARIKGLHVIARTSSFSFKNQNIDVRTIGQRLGAVNILEGSVRVAGDRLRVTAQLINAQHGIHQWSQTYDSFFSDVFEIQNDISENIISSLKTVMELDEQEVYISGGTESIEAYTYLLRGREYTHNGSFPGQQEDYLRSIDYYEQALQLDPKFADAMSAMASAYAGLADIYDLQLDSEKYENARDRAESLILYALALNPQSSEAYETLGLIQIMEENSVEAESALRQAIAFNPNNARAYYHLTSVIGTDRYDDSRRAVSRAHELDPRDPDIVFAIGQYLTFEGKLREASEYYRLALELGGMSRAAPRDLPPTPSNLGFESGTAFWNFEGQPDYEFLISDSSASAGTQSGHIRAKSSNSHWSRLIQAFAASPHAERTVQVKGKIKTKGLGNNDHAGIWVRVDNVKGVVGFDNMTFNLIMKEIDWTEFEVRSYVPSDSVAIFIGAYMGGVGTGEMWIDDFRIEVSDSPDVQ